MLRSREGSGVVHTVWMPASLVEQMKDDAARFAPSETGGMLIGYENAGCLVVTRLVASGPRAIRSRASFTPDGKWQQAELEHAYADSGRTETYLGDWHSHPRGAPRPSRRDRRTAARVAREPRSRRRTPLTLIVGDPYGDGWQPRPYVYLGWRGFRQLDLATY